MSAMDDNPPSSALGSRVSVRVRDEVVNGNDIKGAEFVIHSNLRVFWRSICALSKIAEDLYLETSDEGLSIKSFNRSQTAHAVFRFSPDFFSESDTSLVRNETQVCRISMKSALMMLKGVNYTDKNFTACKMNIDPNSDFLLVSILMSYDISRVLNIKLLECPSRTPQPPVSKDNMRNVTVVAAEIIAPILQQIRSDSEELTIVANKDLFQFKNYQSNDATMGHYTLTDTRSSKRFVKTEASINVEKFLRHDVSLSTELCLGLREFSAIVMFADQHMSVLSLYYDHPGKPIIVSIESHTNFTADFILGTTNDDEDEEYVNEVVQNNVEQSSRTEESTTRAKKTSRKGPKSKKRDSAEVEVEPRVFASQEVPARVPTGSQEQGEDVRKRSRRADEAETGQEAVPDLSRRATGSQDAVEDVLHRSRNEDVLPNQSRRNSSRRIDVEEAVPMNSIMDTDVIPEEPMPYEPQGLDEPMPEQSRREVEGAESRRTRSRNQDDDVMEVVPIPSRGTSRREEEAMLNQSRRNSSRSNASRINDSRRQEDGGATPSLSRRVSSRVQDDVDEPMPIQSRKNSSRSHSSQTNSLAQGRSRMQKDVEEIVPSHPVRTSSRSTTSVNQEVPPNRSRILNDVDEVTPNQSRRKSSRTQNDELMPSHSRKNSSRSNTSVNQDAPPNCSRIQNDVDEAMPNQSRSASTRSDTSKDGSRMQEPTRSIIGEFTKNVNPKKTVSSTAGASRTVPAPRSFRSDPVNASRIDEDSRSSASRRRPQLEKSTSVNSGGDNSRVPQLKKNTSAPLTSLREDIDLIDQGDNPEETLRPPEEPMEADVDLSFSMMNFDQMENMVEHLAPTPPPAAVGVTPLNSKKSSNGSVKAKKRKEPSEPRQPRRNKKLRRILMGQTDFCFTQQMSQQFAGEQVLANDSDWENN
ncbi:unnamed protein product [Caenorhabditis auriculariae]|uniref:Cell cycle checkpoint control protein n=1 Tax=Caenorhabditis auriculariae TaxID=2777116 RepID=A0A8S1HH87_9PELO|nr:unnamed protein product [Caenorhabditis auriculariae]